MGQDLSVILKKSQGRVTSLASTWSEAVCFLVVLQLDAATRVALGGSVTDGRSSAERPCAGVGGPWPRWPRPTATRTATTLENGEKATARAGRGAEKSDAGYIHGGGGGAGGARCREKRRRLHTRRRERGVARRT